MEKEVGLTDIVVGGGPLVGVAAGVPEAGEVAVATPLPAVVAVGPERWPEPAVAVALPVPGTPEAALGLEVVKGVKADVSAPCCVRKKRPIAATSTAPDDRRASVQKAACVFCSRDWRGDQMYRSLTPAAWSLPFAASTMPASSAVLTSTGGESGRITSWV